MLIKQKDDRTLNIRKATQPEPKLKAIYATLGVDLLSGGTKKRVEGESSATWENKLAYIIVFL